MSNRGKKILRVVLGFLGGGAGGIVLGICSLLLVVVVCSADGGDVFHEPKHHWVRSLMKSASVGIPAVFPLVGAILGAIWAIHRNKRENGAAHAASLRAE